MTANRGLFVRNNANVGTTPIEGRLVLAALVAEASAGVPRQGLLDQKTPNVVTGTTATSPMSYTIGPCTPVLNRATNEGAYVFTLTSNTTVTTTAAPGTGSRWDLIYVKQNDLDKGDSANTAIVGVVNGTASASPTKPYASVPAGAYVLAEAEVKAGATSTSHANVTISQVFRYTALRGAPIPVRDQAERDEITLKSPGLTVARLDRLGATERWNGTKWLGGYGSITYSGIYKDYGLNYEGSYWTQTDSGLVTISGMVASNPASITHIAQQRYKFGSVPPSLGPNATLMRSAVVTAGHWNQPIVYVDPDGSLWYSVNTTASASFYLGFEVTYQAKNG